MMRRSLLVLALAAPLAAACHKESAAPTTPSNKTELPNANATADDVLGFLPGDADIVGGIDAVALRNSALWQKFGPQLTAAMGAKYDRFVQECGFDAVKQTERLTVGGKVDANGKFEGVIVLRGVQNSHLLDCMAKEMQKESAVTNAGGVLTVTDRTDGEKMTATIVGGNSLVVVASPAAGTLTLDKVLASGTPLRGSAAFMELFNRREANASVWGMINGNSPVLAQAAAAGARPKSIDGTLVVNDKFDGTVRATFATADEATAMQKQLEQVAQMGKGQVTTADVVANGPTVSMHIVATDEQLKTIMGMLGAFM